MLGLTRLVLDLPCLCPGAGAALSPSRGSCAVFQVKGFSARRFWGAGEDIDTKHNQLAFGLKVQLRCSLVGLTSLIAESESSSGEAETILSFPRKPQPRLELRLGSELPTAACLPHAAILRSVHQMLTQNEGFWVQTGCGEPWVPQDLNSWAGDPAGRPPGGGWQQMWPRRARRAFLGVPTRSGAGTPRKHMTNAFSGK